MTPEQKLKHLILMRAAELNGDAPPENVTAENIDDLYEETETQDAREEVREGEAETRLDTPYSRHYESNAVAAKAPDGSWIGWTYWYGGGKHGNPEEIDWIEHAYSLTCTEEQKMVTVQTFAKAA